MEKAQSRARQVLMETILFPDWRVRSGFETDAARSGATGKSGS